MTINNATSFETISTVDLSSGRTIAHAAESALDGNINFAARNIRPPIVTNVYNTTTPEVMTLGGGALVVDQFHASTSHLFSSFRVRPHNDFSSYTCQVVYSANSATADASCTLMILDVAADGTTTGLGSVTLPAAAVGWNVASFDFSSFTFTGAHTWAVFARNTVNMQGAAAGGEDAVMMIRSIAIYPKTPTLAAGAMASGFLAHATEEHDGNSPLSVSFRNRQFQNIEALRKNRTDTIVSFADDFKARDGDEVLSTTESDWTTVAVVPFVASHGQTKINWSLIGHRVGSSGAVRITTKYMTHSAAASAQYRDVTLNSGWSTGTTHPGAWVDSTESTLLECAPNSDDNIVIKMKGDGSDKSKLMGFVAQFEAAE